MTTTLRLHGTPVLVSPDLALIPVVEWTAWMSGGDEVMPVAVLVAMAQGIRHASLGTRSAPDDGPAAWADHLTEAERARLTAEVLATAGGHGVTTYLVRQLRFVDGSQATAPLTETLARVEITGSTVRCHSVDNTPDRPPHPAGSP